MSSYGPKVPQQAAEAELTAPRRFKTAFIFFSSQRHKQIKEELAKQGKTEKTTNIAKMVSSEWREMSEEDRAVWNEKSRIDKERYDHEMQEYNQARKLSKTNIKDPNAPRRPMSAFLAFSNKRRASLKREHPTATNADLSKMLSKSWKEIPPEVKEEYVQEEAKLRAKYKTDAVVWRKKKAEEAKATASKKATEERESSPRPVNLPSLNASAVGQRVDATNKEDQSALIASLGNRQPLGGMGHVSGASNVMISGDLLGALHNRMQGPPRSISIDAAILDNLTDHIRLQQHVANQHSLQLQQQLASSLTGPGYYVIQQQPQPREIHSLALVPRLVPNNGQNLLQLQQSQIGDATYVVDARLIDSLANQQGNNGFSFPPGFQNNGWFR